MNAFGLIIVGAGLFALAGAVFDWDFFMESRKARFFTAIVGRTGARIFYTILGIALLVLGALMAAGVIQESS